MFLALFDIVVAAATFTGSRGIIMRVQANIIVALTALACLSTVYSFGLQPVHRAGLSSRGGTGSSSCSSSFSPAGSIALPRASRQESSHGLLFMGGEDSKDQTKAKREVRG